MPVVTPINVKPFSLASASTVPMVDEWNRGAGRALAESARAIAALATARRGGIEVRSESGGVRANINATRTGVAAARPIAEASLAWLAQSNRGGASASISRARANAGNPSAPVPGFDPNRPFQQLTGPLSQLETAAERLARREQEAEDRDAEREAKEEERFFG